VTTLLVASTGGHLKELHHLHRRLAGVKGPYRWATFDTPQSRSLLAGERVDFVPFVGGRDPLNVARNLAHAHDALRGGEIDTVVSTGSAVALPFFALSRSRRIRCHYIESAARIEGPSLTGRLIGRIPGVRRYSQYRGWRRRGWSFGGSVFDSFAGGADREIGERSPKKVVVTLGTYRGYAFTRLVRRLLEILPAEADVLWQTGDTDVKGLGIAGHYAIPERDLTAAMREADVVVAHAGVGTALAAFEVGKCPLLVPRRFSLGEHVDDHQAQIAGELGERGLAVSVDAAELSQEDLLLAASRSVTSAAQAPTFATSDGRRGASPSPVSRSRNSS
jgi:UDP-N-acetylglucosamine--N-acetylmuramyl-(pentapeptide) pyrophosphoryl-undecaprenol N-acetylglucosamine transferase